MTRRKIYFALLVSWVAFTFLLTSLPNPEVDVPLPYFDKIAHFVFYGMMGFLCAMWRRECGQTGWTAILSGLAFAALAGAVDEVHQNWIPGRQMELIDWLADATGGGLGALFSLILPTWFRFLITE